MSAGGVGASTNRLDALAKTAGQAGYTVDVELPGMLHAAVLRSPHANARILRIDTERARRLPGVAAVVTGRDRGVERTYGWYIKDQPILSGERVRYVGDMVAAVAAVDLATAIAAVELIDVDYEPLDPVMSIEAALAPQAPTLFPDTPPGRVPHYGHGTTGSVHPEKNVCYRFNHTSGDPAAFERCDHIFEDTFGFSAMQHYHLEPFVAVATVVDGDITVHSSNQNPFALRRELARLFECDEQRVQVKVGYVGGAFGAKNMCKTEPVAIVLARETGKPVRFCLTAAEAFLTQRQHSATLRMRTGVMNDGTVIARHCDVLLDSGAYADASPLVAEKAAFRAPGPYRWDHVNVTASCVLTTTTPAGPFRGFGAPQATWASESQLDMIADRLGIDPLELRRKNLRRLGEPFLPGDSGIDSDLHAGLEEVAEALGYHDQRRRAELRGRDRGLGLSVGLKDAGGGRKPASARVRVSESGEITLYCGTVELGQGGQTTLRQIVAQILDVPVGEVGHAPVDTEAVPYDQGTYASSSTTVMGRAVAEASYRIRERVIAALHPDPPGNGRAELPAGWRARVAGHGFDESGHFEVAEDAAAPLGEKCFFWEPGWAGAEVEVDRGTGRIILHRLIVCGDAGKMVNPRLCHGQEQGSVMMGIGQAMVEGIRYVDGELATRDPLTYPVMTFLDLPPELELLVQEQGHGPGPFGAKGYGEAGMVVVAAAVANAVYDAVGVRLTELPLTPEKVFWALAARDESDIDVDQPEPRFN